MKIPTKIGIFTLYKKKPNTLDKGYYYQVKLHFEVPNDFKERYVRVYLPSDYEFNNPKHKYPVMYMTDGQNLCDHYLSGYGEWCCDETIEKRIKEGKTPFIVVGIDCPYDDKARLIEMSIPCPSRYAVEREGLTTNLGNGYAPILAKFILKTVKPIIDKTFYTLKNKTNTAVGGSSMGGLMAFYMGMKYKNIVGYSLCFSPGFLIYEDRYFVRKLSKAKLDPKEYGRFILYVGGKDFEQQFVASTFACYNILRSKGFSFDQLRLIFDSNNIHHEVPWSKYYVNGVEYWLDYKGD